MSGRAAKARRQAEKGRVEETLRRAHDQLHKDDPEAAHELLHEALGVGETGLGRRALTGNDRFDAAFRNLCTGHGVRAAYVGIGGNRESDGAVLLVSGGDAEIGRLLDAAVRQVIASSPRGDGPPREESDA